MNPFGVILTLFFCAMATVGSRKVAAAAIILGTCYITQGQELNIGFHFTAIRLVLLASLARVIAKGELSQISFNGIDRALIAYGVCIAVVSTLRVGTGEQLTYQAGVLYNVFLAYFVFRALVRGESDIFDILQFLAIPLVPLAMFMILEAYSGRNIFAIFGGVGEVSMVREGHVRCAAAFRSPITAGAFGATFALLYIGMLFARHPNRRKVILGLFASMVVTICAHSSGPFLGMVFGVISLACWKVRTHTSFIRRSIVATLVILHFFIMKAPVWFLIARVSDIVGGGGYHRSLLIDQFLNHFGSWWIAGTDDTSGWMPYELESGGTDLTNQFVSDGVNAGVIGMVFSIFLVVRCFQGVGIAMRARSILGEDAQKMTWALGSTLVASVAILFSVTYFDQMQGIWFFLLACIASIASEKIQPITQEFGTNDHIAL